ncbi:MAG: hypothetical protein NBV76_05280 [Candidatus Ochrobactrum gambitense]|nr:MAG: hypothetical protein NBV76_05280 [Candidatus Ochrobactrum gambitense]WEK17216.1 MAG: hypothetical protein P0Y54_05680 [Candidatus Ochrobactrum gambitense]
MELVEYDLGNGRKVYRFPKEKPQKPRSDLACPMLVRDFDEPVQSMADGKWYTSKRDLARSHRASGNPHGQDFIELGNDEMPFVEHKTDENKLREDIRAAKADLDAGWRPDVVALDD